MRIDPGFIVSAYVPKRPAPGQPNPGNPAGILVAPQARGMSNEKYLFLKKAEDYQKVLADKTARVLDSPDMQVREKTKARAREKLQQIVEKLKILKKLFSGNPREMARALTQVMKELKAALKDYRDAAKGQMDLSGPAAATIVTPQQPPSASTAQGENAHADGDERPGTQDEMAHTEAANGPTAVLISKGDLVRSVRKAIGEDGMDFLKQLRSLIDEIDDKLITPARIQKAAQKPDKDTEESFEDLEKELKELRKAMREMERDLKHAAPETGLTLDIVA